MIHVCFAIHDGTGTYSRFTGMTMLSLFENANNAPNDRSKGIPYWIDYTNLIVNDKMIFDTLTPA